MDNLKENDKKAYAIFIVFIFSIGNIYSLPKYNFVSFGEVFAILYLVYLGIKKIYFKRNFSINRTLLLFLFYSLVTTSLNILLYNLGCFEAVKRIARDLFYYFVALVVGIELFDIKVFKKYVTIFAIILCSFILIQFVVYQLFGYYVPGFLLKANISGNLGRELYNHYLTMAKISGYLKPNGFLAEPSHCAQYLFMGLILLLFYENTKNDIKVALYITIGMLLTFSASAIIFILFSWGIFFIQLFFKQRIKKTAFLWLIIFCVVIVLIFSFLKEKGIMGVIERIYNSSSKDTIDGSANYRLYKGFSQFNQIPFLNRIFGIGFGNYTEFYELGYFDIQNEYMNSLSYILVSGGALGLILYISAFITEWNKMNTINKISFYGLIIMMFFSSIYSTVVYIWFLNLIFKRDVEFK